MGFRTSQRTGRGGRLVTARAKRCLVTAGVVLIASVSSSGPGLLARSTTVSANAATGQGIPVWYAQYMSDARISGPMTLERAVAQAREFDVIAARRLYRPYVAEMKAANPNARILNYIGTFAASTSSSFPESYYAHDQSGARIRLTGYSLYQMEPSSAGWAAQAVRRCSDELARSGYDGCFLDMLGATPAIYPQYLTGLLPVNPRTGALYTPQDWLNATTNVARQVGAAVAPKVVYGNGLGGGHLYYYPPGPSSQIFGSAVGVMAENWLRGPYRPVDWYPWEADWKKCVDMLVDAASRGGVVLTMTKVWLTTVTRAEKNDWHRFALATFLLGYQPGHAYFSFRYDRSEVTGHPWWEVNLGAPLGSYSKLSTGVYSRPFANGLALVNPTTETEVVALARPSMTLAGTWVTSVTLEPHDAEILRY